MIFSQVTNTKKSNFSPDGWVLQKAVKSRSGKYYWKNVKLLRANGLFRNLQLVINDDDLLGFFFVVGFLNTKELGEKECEIELQKLNKQYKLDKSLKEILK